jgi:molybdopterin-guanine dinucleotide biosynthesis protein A
MTRLGAILAGGEARRFGTDKAAALIGGVTLIDHARVALSPHVDRVIIVGREIEDRPAVGLGPLGGLCAALHHALEMEYTEVLTVPCDVPFPPPALFSALTDAPVICADHPIFGLWPSTLSPVLDEWLAAGRSGAVRAFADSIGARRITIAEPIRDVDTPEDLAALS